MAGTRSSARLANAKGKQVKQIKDEEVDDPMLLDEVSVKVESEYDVSEDDESQSRPPSKRQRTSAKPVKSPTRKKQVRGKQGRLAGLVNMPIDIFTEISLHLLPVDIISLSRANKFFRNLLMDRSSSHIWHGAMRNVRGLPPCPPDLSEPHYLALLFSKHCTMCGQPVRCRMDEILRVRLCVPCREEHLIALDNVSWELRSLVHHSGKIVPSKRRWGPDTDHALKEEVREVERAQRELGESGDERAILAWEVEKRTAISERLKEAIEIQEFLNTIEHDREQELREMKHERRRDIENRLAKLGWDKKDMQFNYHFPSRREWYSLVEQPKPLTERIWTNLRPKLIPILEANREARLQKERAERESSRRTRLMYLLNEIKQSQVPVLDITVRAPTNPQATPSSNESEDVSLGAGPSGSGEAQSPHDDGDASSPETSSAASHATSLPGGTSGAAKPPIHTTFPGIFPDIVDALEWPFVKALHETDVPVNEMEQNFVERRSEIDAAIADWKTSTHARLAERLRQDQDIEGELLTPRLIVQKDDSDPFANLSDDLKLLLRADSLFVGPQNDSQRRIINSYDATLTRFGYRLALKDGMMSKPYKAPLDPTRIRVCSEARQVARVLLSNMGLENASIAELKSVGRGYACARCHDSGLKTWEDLVLHFIEAKEVFARVQEHGDQLESLSVTYRDVHNPEVFPDRPLVKYTPEHNGNLIRACVTCSKDPIKHEVRGPEVKIIQHVKDVHDIIEPKLGTHYSISTHPHILELDSSLEFDFEIDGGMFFTHFGLFNDLDLPSDDGWW